MDSERMKLLQSAHAFGSLAQNMTFQGFLDDSVTYRTSAGRLGIQDEWWDAFWRSYSIKQANYSRGCRNTGKKFSYFRVRSNPKDIAFLLTFMKGWFGGSKKISEIAKHELRYVFFLIMAPIADPEQYNKKSNRNGCQKD